VVCQVSVHGLALVGRDRIDIRESTTASKSGNSDFTIGLHICSRWKISRSNGEEVGTWGVDIQIVSIFCSRMFGIEWATNREVRVENISTATDTAVGVALIAGWGCHSRVSRGYNNSGTLQATLQKLSALTGLVGCWEIDLGTTVRDGDNMSLYLRLARNTELLLQLTGL
jgi:hypothetical protein